MGCAMHGANVISLGATGTAFRPLQCASRPSPRLDTMPMPVITTSRRTSAIGERFHRKFEAGGCLFHHLAECGIGKWHDAKRQFCIAGRLAVHPNERLGDGVTGTVVD